MQMNKFEVWENAASILMPVREWIIAWRIKKYFAPYLNSLHGKTVLEIGSGSGSGARMINRFFAPAKIIASEFDQKLVDAARKNTKDKNIVFEQQDAAKLTYPDESFDAVFDFKVIHHIPYPQWQSALQEAYRVLKPGGMFFIIDQGIEAFKTPWGRFLRLLFSHPYDSMFTEAKFVDCLKQNGFTIAVHEKTSEHFAIAAKK